MFVQEIQVSLKRKYIDTSALKVILSSDDVVNYARATFFNECEDHSEHMFAIFLNNSNKIIGHKCFSSGGLTGTVSDTRIILSVALQLLAVNIILLHNHPSGNLKPSEADKRITDKTKEAAKLFDMTLHDHIILTPFPTDGYYSFADNGNL